MIKLAVVALLTFGCTREPSPTLQPEIEVATGAPNTQPEQLSTNAHTSSQAEPHRCTGDCANHVHRGEPRENTNPVAVAAGVETFGATPSGAASVDVEEIFARPNDFQGRVVRLDGTVERVCQRMGCWMELHAGARTLRVPMAGHAFFLPRDCAGKRASVEGTIQVAELPAEMRAHLESEGAQNTSSHIELNASSVVLTDS